jgi:hypothetical protein
MASKRSLEAAKKIVHSLPCLEAWSDKDISNIAEIIDDAIVLSESDKTRNEESSPDFSYLKNIK